MPQSTLLPRYSQVQVGECVQQGTIVRAALLRLSLALPAFALPARHLASAHQGYGLRCAGCNVGVLTSAGPVARHEEIEATRPEGALTVAEFEWVCRLCTRWPHGSTN